MMMERSATVNRLWIFLYYYQQDDSSNKWEFCCADPEENYHADLLFKYEDIIGGWGHTNYEIPGQVSS